MKQYNNPNQDQWPKIAKRNAIAQKELSKTIQTIFNDIEKNGDESLIRLTNKFDGVKLNSISLSLEEVKSLANETPKEIKQAINNAYKNINKYHQQTSKKQTKVKIADGIECWSETRPIEKVGLYVPGGSAPLVSTVLMLGVPAKIAGVKEIVLFTPPNADGKINPAICYAAIMCGIGRIFTVGGAQAVAAMAIGTETIPKVDKIFGPGNQYVTSAKQYAMNYSAAIDVPAGPSEVMVIADKAAEPKFVAADLLSQAEHGLDSQSVLLTDSEKLAKEVKKEISRQLKNLSRQDIAALALKKSFIIVIDESNAIKFANFYAPEHLIINTNNPAKISKEINNAGSVFLGQYSPESAGDYASGTNHTLPTSGWARSYSGLSVSDFQRSQTFQKLTKAGLKSLAKTITTLAELEGLDAHAKAVKIRFDNK